MRIDLGTEVWCGRAIDLSHVPIDLDAAALVQAIRDENDPTVECASPGPLHEHVGWIWQEMDLHRRTALAAVARSNGLSAPQDEERERILKRIDALSLETIETATHRKRLAAKREDIIRYRERVARLQGRVQAFRERENTTEIDGNPDALDSLETAIRELSEIETERVAAEQALEQARKRQQRMHDRRDERLALEDREANLARDARKHLAARVEEKFETTLETVPRKRASKRADADPVSAALAIARLGTIDAPVVLECDRFTSAQRAKDWLEVPVILL